VSVAASHPCPRCKTPLEPATLRRIPVEACKGCKGTLLAQGRLSELLDELSAPLLRSFDIDAKLEATQDADELGAMTLMWARMNGRQAREQAITRAVSMSFLPSAVRFGSVDRSTLSRTVFDLLFW
jgi:Zn-finger nucleic acid-binding protein